MRESEKFIIKNNKVLEVALERSNFIGIGLMLLRKHRKIYQEQEKLEQTVKDN